MAIKHPKRPDETIKQIVNALKDYERGHPNATIELKRQNSVSVRIRVLDVGFKGKPRSEREDEFWEALERLPEDVVSEISMVLLLTPDEARDSFASFEFDNPIRSRL